MRRIVFAALLLLAAVPASDAQVPLGQTAAPGGTVSGTVTANQGTPAAVGNAWPVTPVAGAAGGGTKYHLAGLTASGTNSTSVVAGSHALYRLTATNPTVTGGWLRLYDSATAPTCSSATNAADPYWVPPSGGINITDPVGVSFSNGIAFCFTGGGTDTDNTNGPAGVSISMNYK